MSNNLESRLSEWGASLRHLPKQNDEIKNVVLASSPRSTHPASVLAVRTLPWLSFAFAVLALIAFLTPSIPLRPLPVKMLPVTTLGESANISRATSLFAPSYPRPESEAPVADTRELLKTDYQATVRSRQVLEVGKRLQTLIRGHEGRLDYFSLSEQYGSLTFVVPALKLDAFRAELLSIAGKRFVIEQISAQNLLPEQRAIAAEQGNAETALDRLLTERLGLVASFRRTEAALNEKIAAAMSDDEKHSLESELSRERRTYESRKRSLDTQIQSLRDRLQALDEQSGDLLDSVATVRGTISLERLSLYGLVNTYLQGYTVALLFVFLSIGAYLYHGRRIRLTRPAT